MQLELLDGQRVFTVARLLSAEECDALIQRSESIGYETFTIDGEAVPGFRNNGRAFLEDDALAAMLWARVGELIPSEVDNHKVIGLSPRFRFYRYRGGESFVAHHDGVTCIGESESKLTFMVYLSDVAKGGETRFYGLGPTVRFNVRPECGKALIFEHVILHEGVAVEEGCKYVLRTDVMFEANANNGTGAA